MNVVHTFSVINARCSRRVLSQFEAGFRALILREGKRGEIPQPIIIKIG